MYDGPIIDVDVHHRWHSEDDLLAYLPRPWREALDRQRNQIHLEGPYAAYHHTTGSNKRADSAPPTGGPPGSDHATLCEQWLDTCAVERAVLSFDIGMNAGVVNPVMATALCRAANDWSLDRWIAGTGDDRLYGAIQVPTQIVEDGVREIHRLAGHPRIVEALVVWNGLGKPFGHPAYDPIFAAAEEYGLPIAIHTAGDTWGSVTHAAAGGLPATRFEYHTLVPQSTITHLVSLITNGVFEKFPGLRVCAIEIGFSWLPWLLWTLDRHQREIRRENPLVKRLPSEYFREHIRVSTQPIEMSPRRDQLIEALEAAGGIEDILVFASDYPHWDTDDPGYIARHLPRSWASKVFYRNALELLRWPDDTRLPADLPTRRRSAAAT